MTPCSSVEQLQLFLSGTLAELEAETLRAHLAACPACQRTMDRLSDHPDLRAWAALGRPTDRDSGEVAALSRLLNRLRPLADTPPLQPGDTGPFADVSPCGERTSIGHFRVLGELGRGGMGVVVKAYDPDLDRVVAVKILGDERAGGAARERFVREARAAAGIEHEHVVTVHSVASPRDGPPYLVMQYVEGPTLRERIAAEKRLEPRTAARLAAQIADGLASAHRRGLIHRDIKPSNVILAAGDRAKITDFGLVRIKEQPGDITREGMIAGTPEYMSPEQISEPDRIDERSDVYGLGVTLYEMLTGATPFRGAAQMVIQQVLREEPVALRRLNDAVPRDVQTICLKAMAKEPDRRYQTAGELGDDLQRWLNGEPIHARPVRRAEKAWQWCKRKPALATVTAALVAALVVGFVGVFSQWRRAETNLVVADQQRGNAENSLRGALETVNQFCVDVSEDVLLNEPGMQPLRKQLLGSARDYFLQFVQERGDNPRLRRELAKSYLRLAQIESEIGSADEALKLINTAVTQFDQLAAENPGVPVHANDRAMAYNALGVQLRSLKRLSNAKSLLETAHTIAEEVVRANSDVSGYSNQLAVILDNMGVVFIDLKYPDRAEELYKKALDIWQRLADRAGAVSDYAASRAMVQEHLGQAYRALGRLEPQQTALDEALMLRTRLWERQTTNPKYRAELARTYDRLGVCYMETKRILEGKDALLKAIDFWQQLADDNRRVTRYQQQLAASYSTLGLVYYRAGKLAESESAHKTALQIRERLTSEQPNYPDYRADLADSHFKLGMVHRRLNRMPESEKSHLRAMELHRKNAAEHPDAPEFQESLARAHNDLGLVHRGNKKYGPAIDEFRQSLDIWGRLAGQYVEIPDYPDQAARTGFNIGLIHKTQDQFDDAEREFRRSLDVWGPMVQKTPRPAILTSMAMTHRVLADILRDIGHDRADPDRLQESLEAYIAAEKSLRQLLQADEQNSEAMDSLRSTYWGRAQALEFVDRWPEAVEDWDRALEMELRIEPVSYRDQILLLRARARAHVGRYVPAVQETDELVAKPSLPGGCLKAAAKVYAAASHAARTDPTLSGADREERVEGNAARAVEMLWKAREGGELTIPAEIVRTANDPDLKLLRDRADFQKLLTELHRRVDPK